MITRGFTILELLVVLVIIGILSFMLYPNYTSYLVNSRRLEGQMALLALASQMENHYALHQTYEKATIGKDTNSANNWYKLYISSQTDTFFELDAIPLKSQAVNDKLCQTLTFNSLGKKDIKAGPLGAPTGNADFCW